jgi:hypothetical protein
LEIPVKIEGSWDNPRFRPDVERLLQDPAKVIESVKKFGDKFKDLKKSKDVGKLLNQFLGKSQSQGDQTGGQSGENQTAEGQAQQGEAQTGGAPAQKQVRPEDLLDQLFR